MRFRNTIDFVRSKALCALLCAALCTASAVASAEGAYRNFKAAIYITVGTTRQLANPRTLSEQYSRIASQLRFDKVYLETYRNGQFADEASLEAIKKFFTGRGIAVSGGVTLAAGGHSGQFGTFDYEDPRDRAECQRAVELAARHFDEVILDDFFFYTTKSDADIAAKGKRTWTQYRLERMREVAETLVLKPARAINPHVRMIIKYPNWYEHFQGLGYDLDVEARRFDGIYTGTETRDPQITDQLLQQYESYLIFRYYDNIRPHGGNRGGWVDTFSTRYIDRYAEQLWDTLFAKAPEITLFNWSPLASPEAVAPGERDAWSHQATSFNWEQMTQSVKGPKGTAAAPGWARAAGYSLEQVDAILGKLGRPIGVASYKPYQSGGEEFLHDYLGNIGIPIELAPEFPKEAPLVLLTEAAQQDPDIVAKIKGQLTAGKNVVVTSGLLHALQGRGIEDIAELEYTGRKVTVHDFLNGYGAGNGTSLNDAEHDNPGIVFPEIRFYTNDAWALIRGVSNAHGFPILLMNRYSRGIFYVLNIPDNSGDLYSLPQPVARVIKSYLQADFPVRIDAPAHVSLFAYDNGTFVVQSFRSEAADVSISTAGANGKLRNMVSAERPTAEVEAASDRQAAGPQAVPRTTFKVRIPAHSYAAFAIE
jgi:voltage-gated potassium channel Kch